MTRYIFLITALILFAGCGTAGRPKIENPQPDYDPDALYYYSMAEAALNMKDINSAAQLLRMALSYSSEDLVIKERLLEVLSTQAKFNPEIHDEIISLGEECATRKDCPNKILIILAESYSFTGNIPKGEHYLRKALDKEPSMQLYLSYYIFRKSQMDDDDLSLLEEALKTDWKDQKTVLIIAEIFHATDPDSSLRILNRAYDKWSEERVLIPILGIHERRGETKQLMSRIQDHLDNDYPASDFLKEHLLDMYFKTKDLQSIVDNKDICLELDREPALRYLFFSAISIDDVELALETAELIESKNDLPENIIPLFKAYQGYINFRSKNYTEAAENFLLSNDINLVLDIFFEYELLQKVSDEDIEEFTNSLLQTSDHIDMAHFLSGYLFAILENDNLSNVYLSRVSIDYLLKYDLVETTAVILLNVDESNLDVVKEMLSKREEQSPSVDELLGFYYYNIQRDSLAYQYFRKDVEHNTKPSIRLITAATILAEKYNDRQFIINTMDIATALYPEETEILNLFGYSIADLKIEEKYPFAEEVLTKAVQLDPDNLMYWDSLAWLYFRTEEYDKAIAAMEKPLAIEVSNSEIAYHLGEIYLKLNDISKARFYLELAVELDNHADSVNLSRSLLEEFINSKEN